MDELDRAMAATLSATRVMVAIGARELYELDPNMTLPQYRAMVVLSYAGPKRLSELAADLGVSRATAGRVAFRLEKAGFVERGADTGDGRATLVCLSALGVEVIRRVSVHRQAMFQRALANLSQGELGTVAAALEKFVADSGEPVYEWDSRARPGESGPDS